MHRLGRPSIGTLAGTLVGTGPLPYVVYFNCGTLVHRKDFLKCSILRTFQCMHLFFMAEGTVSGGTGLHDHVLGWGVWLKLGNPTEFRDIVAVHPLCNHNVASTQVNMFAIAVAYDGSSSLVGVHGIGQVQNEPVPASRDKHCLNSEPIPIMAGVCVLIRGLHKVCKRSLWTLSTLERGTLAPLPFFLWLAGMSL